jgi:hypothetical protein
VAYNGRIELRTFDQRRFLCYPLGDGKQDGYIGCARTRTFNRDGAIAGCALFRYQHTWADSMQAGVLRKQELLRDIAPAHGTGFATVIEIEFRSANICDNFAYVQCCTVCCGCRRSKVSFRRRIERAFAADSRCYLHSPYLIQRA